MSFIAGRKDMKGMSQWLSKYKHWVVAAFAVLALLGIVLQLGVSTNYNVVDYLPQDVQSTKAMSIIETQFASAIPNARVMLNDVTVAEAIEFKGALMSIDGVSDVLWLDDILDIRVPLEVADQQIVRQYYRNGSALISITIRGGEESRVVEAIYQLIGEDNALAGQAADRANLQQMTGSEVRGATLIILPLITIILLLSTSSWIEPLLFLAAIGVSVLINMGTNIIFGEVSFITKSVSPILQLAVSLDYAIFLLHSFEHYRQQTDDVAEAMGLAIESAFPTIAASAATTLFGFMALMFMRFEIGADLGLNLVKGIVFSFFSVLVFLPALTLSCYKLIDKTRHKKLMPDFTGVGQLIYKLRIPVVILVIVLLIPSFLAQSQNNFLYGDSGLGAANRSGRDAQAIEEAFGGYTPLVVLVPRGDTAKELLLSQELEALAGVSEVLSYVGLVGNTIPPEFIESSIVSQFYSDHYARFIVSTTTAAEGEIAFALVEAVQARTKNYYGTGAYFAGPSVTLYDMKNVVTADSKTVNTIAIAAIMAVLFLTFKSLTLPILLVITIEAAIWVNLAVPYFMGSSLSYVGFLIINAVQLGATVDYAILFSNHYMRNRKATSRSRAVCQTISETLGSILVSASILAFAGVTLWRTSSNPVVSELGLLLGRGTALSMLMVVCFLPAVLTLSDRLIEKTTFQSEFFKER